MDATRADLLHRRIELYRETLRAGARGTIAILYLRQIESDESELARLSRGDESGLTSRGLSADARPLRPLSKYLTELIDQFDDLGVTDPRRARLAMRIRRVEAEIARRRSFRRH